MPLGKTNTRMLTGTEFDQWNSSYTTVKAQSASNASTYSTVQSNSATWGSGGGLTQPQVFTRIFFKI